MSNRSLINTTIEPFQATAYHDGKFVELSEHNLLGHWSVMFFYPADFTFVCPTELGDLADHYAEFKAMGVEIYSVSTDTHFTHKAWHDTSETIGKIKYPMIGDPSGKITNNFGVMREGVGLADRGTLATGQRADFVVWNAEHPRELAYRFGHNPCRTVICGGRVRESA